MKILVINGPNLNLLGKREQSLYGKLSLKDIENKLNNEFKGSFFEFFQSNHEGEIIDKIQISKNKFDAIVINPGGFAHSSVAIRDALEEIDLIKIEVHLSNLSKRENFRQNLITASACDGYISGFKEESYSAAVHLIEKYLKVKEKSK
ncbi:MAG: 3-dehydroquinate dehydratase [Ignavibacteriales bacterium CG12_big_fil_rev_8_21_14_0_65_30_8]|nr:MAG: 3-dehydroquinate dehydratase [Ignavibacteriales bacterium CG12_big_fil_rev_8_21_14_0_65_30_8]